MRSKPADPIAQSVIRLLRQQIPLLVEDSGLRAACARIQELEASITAIQVSANEYVARTRALLRVAESADRYVNGVDEISDLTKAIADAKAAGYLGPVCS